MNKRAIRHRDCRDTVLYQRAPWRHVVGGVLIRFRSPVSLPCCVHVLLSAAAAPRNASDAARGRHVSGPPSDLCMRPPPGWQ